MDVNGLRMLYSEAAAVARLAAVKQAEFNLELSKYLAQHRVAPGYSLDLWGEGEISPENQCQLHPGGKYAETRMENDGILAHPSGNGSGSSDSWGILGRREHNGKSPNNDGRYTYQRGV
jgi:hypothetical protein